MSFGARLKTLLCRYRFCAARSALGVPAIVLRHEGHGAFCERCDGQQRIDADRAGHDRAIAHIEPGVDGIRAGIAAAREYLAFVIHHAAVAVGAHAASAKRVRGERLFAHHRRGKRVLHIGGAGRIGGLAYDLADTLIDGLVDHIGPFDRQAVVF